MNAENHLFEDEGGEDGFDISTNILSAVIQISRPNTPIQFNLPSLVLPTEFAARAYSNSFN
jgi:hypothetical protein